MDEDVHPLLQRPVDHAERHPQPAGAGPAGGDQAPLRIGLGRAEEEVEADPGGQGRNPDLVHLVGRVLEPVDEDVEHRRALRVLGADVAVSVPGRFDGGDGGERRRPGGLDPVGGRGPVGARDQRGPEALPDRGVDLEVAHAGDGRELVGVGDTEDRAALDGGEGAQTDPVGEVALQPPQPALLQALRGEQEVDAEAAAEPADGHERVDEVGLLGQQLGELVDDHQQVGEGFEVGPVPLPAGPVLPDVGQVAGGSQEFLAAALLADEGVAHPVDEAEVLVEVGDDAGHVGQLGQAGEGGAALEVDQDHGQVLGGMGGGQGGQEGPQQLRLPRAGGADHQAVGAVASEGRLLQVDAHRLAPGSDPERNVEEVGRRPGLPGPAGVEGGDVGDAEEVADVDHAAPAGGVGREPERRQAPGQPVGQGRGEVVGPAGEGGPAAAAAEGAIGGDDDPPVDLRRFLLGPLHEVDHGERRAGGPGQHPRQPRIAAAAVDHHQEVRASHSGPAAEAGRHLLVGGELELVERLGDEPPGAGPVGPVVIDDVGQPLAPLPVGDAGGGGCHRQLEVLGGVEDDGLGDQRPDAAEGSRPRPLHDERADRAQGNEQGCPSMLPQRRTSPLAAAEQAGSGSAMTSWVAPSSRGSSRSGTRPTPARTARKSPSPVRRSQSRCLLPASAQS